VEEGFNGAGVTSDMVSQGFLVNGLSKPFTDWANGWDILINDNISLI
jgi:hypothetical protein